MTGREMAVVHENALDPVLRSVFVPDRIVHLLPIWQRVVNSKVLYVDPGEDMDQDLDLPMAHLFQHGARHVAAIGKDLHHLSDVNDRRKKLVRLAVLEQLANKGPELRLRLDIGPRFGHTGPRWWGVIAHGNVRRGHPTGRFPENPREQREVLNVLDVCLRRHGSKD